MSAGYETVPLTAFAEGGPSPVESAALRADDDDPPWWAVGLDGPTAALVDSTDGPAVHVALTPEAADAVRGASYEVVCATTGGSAVGTRVYRVRPIGAARPLTAVLADRLTSPVS
jgi:hypothetical protein